jgi:hypothetical protein
MYSLACLLLASLAIWHFSRSSTGNHLIVVLVYILAIVGLSGWVQKRTWDAFFSDADVAYVATMRLPKNTRLSKSYVREPELPPGYFWKLPNKKSLEGMYLSKTMQAGEAVNPAYLRDVPDLREKYAVYSLSGKPELADVVNAESTVRFCAGDGNCKPELAAVRVFALVCTDDTKSHCFLAVSLTDKQDAIFSTRDAAQIAIVRFR